MDLDVAVDLRLAQQVVEARDEVVEVVGNAAGSLRLAIGQVTDDAARQAAGNALLRLERMLQVLADLVELEHRGAAACQTVQDNEATLGDVAVLSEHTDDESDHVLDQACVHLLADLHQNGLDNGRQRVLQVRDGIGRRHVDCRLQLLQDWH